MSGTKSRSGRKALPRAVKELSGTFRADQHNENEPTLAVYETVPRCPGHLKGEAQKTWREMAKLLTAMGVLTPADSVGLEAYCTIYARWREAERQLNQSGLTILKDDGDPTPSPHVKIAKAC